MLWLLTSYPPLFLACGEERNTDGVLFIAREAARQGVLVQLEHYEAMTHVWPTTFPKLPHSTFFLDRWAHCCSQMVRHRTIETKANFFNFEFLEARSVDLINCTSLTREDVIRMLQKSKKARPTLRRKGTIALL